MKSFLRKKLANNLSHQHSSLNRVLNAFDLTLMGIGAIIGAGVFVLTGIAAATKAGPGIAVSYILAGLAAMFSALSYAELSTSIGGSGSAYNYAYVTFGEIIAWIIGWALILEYTMSVSTVAIGWSGYVSNALLAANIHFPISLTKNPFEGGIINLPAVLIIGFLGFLLCSGVKHSATFNKIIVFIKLIVIGIFIFIAAQNVHPENWQVFFPHGFTGVVQGASLVFFAYIGFDAISTAAEETIDPQHNLPIGIISSLFICTVIYIIVALLLTGIAYYPTLNVPSPVSAALINIGYPIAAGIVALGAIAGLTTVMLVMYFGLTRILLAVSRDGLLPPIFSKINKKRFTPIPNIILMGTIIALLAGFVPIQDIAELVNIGTLSAFVIVCAATINLRQTNPSLPRPFKLPWNPVIPTLGIIFCIYLMVNLSSATWTRFIIWMILGLIIYFKYSSKHSSILDK
ncbi:MAG: amino acid permease [Gammaproteobacteria bacterium]|nr:amino acid permease [Gammaproteobacteria bacterium]